MSKVILITGATSGIGKTTAEYLAREGHVIYGTGRSASLSETSEGGVHFLDLDLENFGSVGNLVSKIVNREARIDVLINNAGFGIAGYVETTPIEAVQQQLNVNFLGAVKVTQEVLKVFRKQNSGLIINVTSLAGRFGIPFQAFYSASKFAFEGFSEALYLELKRSNNIRISLVEPTDIKTDFTNRRKIFHAYENKLELETQFKKSLSIIEKDERTGSDTKSVARVIAKIIRSKRPRLRYTAGKGAWLIDFLHNILPENIFLGLIGRHYDIK